MDDLADRVAIHDLNSRYAVSFDTFQLDEAVTCWTVDGVLDESETGFGVFRGHDAIRGFFRDTLFAHAAHVVHLMFNHLVTSIDGDTAEGVVYCLTEVATKDGGHVRAHVRYEDEYVRVAEQWKFRSRVIRSAFPHDALPEHARG